MLPSDLNFGSPLWLWALVLLPALAMLFFWAERQTARRLALLIHAPRLRQQLAGLANAGRRRWRFALLLLGLTGLILTLAQPRWSFETRETRRRGLDLLVIVDVSKSMLATDLTPNRLTRAKLAVQDLIGQLQGDRVGLVAFAGSAFLQAPLTIDYDAVLESVAELDTDLIPRGGTNLGGAIDLALEAFGKVEAGNRAILLLSDGEPTVEGEEASGVEAAGRAAAAGVKVFTVGLGTPEGSLIPLAGTSQGEFVRDEDGKIVRTRLDEGTLGEIARAGRGFYLRFTGGEATMRTIIQDGLSQIKTGDIDARTARRPIERYQWPLGAGLVFLVLGVLVGERRRRGAPAAIDGMVSPDAIAVPVRRTAVAAALWLLCMGQAARAADAEKPSASNPLDLYRDGKYDQAYHAYEDLFKKDPKADSLPFNAGASAYMGKQYDEAMDAFAKALTSGDPALRAKSHYNFGNTLFRRGEDQKDRQAKITDWKNALQHYDSTLDMLRHADAAHRNEILASNTAYNRNLVQQRLNEELKQPPKQQPQKKEDKKDKKDGKDDQKQDGSKQDKKDQQDKSKQDGQDKQDQQQQGGKSDQQPQDQQGSSSSPDQNGEGNQPPKPEDQPQQGKESQQPGGPPENKQDPSKGSSKSQPDQQQTDPSKGKGKEADSKQPSDQSDKNVNEPPAGPPDTSNLPDQDKPRQHGDIQAQPQPDEKKESPPPDKNGEAGLGTGDEPEKEGKMSPAQARALLDALKGEDARMIDLNNKHRRDEPVAKDW